MPNACPIPSRAEKVYGEIYWRIEAEMLRRIDAALRDAADQARSEIEAAGLDMAPPSYGYFVSTTHQRLFCRLCDADPQTFAGGRADVAAAVLRNGLNIARHYWGLDDTAGLPSGVALRDGARPGSENHDIAEQDRTDAGNL